MVRFFLFKQKQEIPNLQPNQVGDDWDSDELGFHQFPQDEKRFILPKGKVVKFGLLILLPTLIIFFFLVLPLYSGYSEIKKLNTSSKVLLSAIREQNIAGMKNALLQLESDLIAAEKTVGTLAWMRFVPMAGNYWQDVDHAMRGGKAGVEALQLAVDAIEPYADILGFRGQAAGPTKTAEDRIQFLINTLDQLIPKIDPISQKTQIMAAEFNKINPDRYPEQINGKLVRERIRLGIRLVNQVNDFITNGKPLLRQLPFLAGVDGERKYLLLFQNDKEIRPTGGFLTAYSIVRVKNGMLYPSVSTDIYNLDKRFNSRIPAPRIIDKYLPLVSFWHLRDMNLSPDFKVSMDTFSKYYSEVEDIEDLDGIIAIDSYPAVWLLQVTGKIGVPGYGDFSAEIDSRCNCPNIIYELESYADTVSPVVWDPNTGEIVFKPANYDNRKDILGPLMRSLITNALGQPKDKMPALFDAFWRSITQKHVLFYMFDPEIQAAMEAFNIAGRIKEYNGDYLHINDANFAGAKTNLYVEEEVALQVEPSFGKSRNRLTITYRNPQSADGWLNGYYRDLVRIYVPAGSKLIDSTGSDEEVKVYDELGKTVFETFFVLRPEGMVRLTFEYETPISAGKQYRLLIQKQPGTHGYRYSVKVDNKVQEFQLTTDRELVF